MKKANIEKGIQALADGRYKVFIKRELPNGTLFRRTRVAQNLALARKAKEEMAQEFIRISKHGVSFEFSEVADQWFEYYVKTMESKGSPLSPTTRGDYASAVNVIKGLVPSDIPSLDKIGLEKIIVTHFISNGRKRKIRSILNMILQYAIHLRIISANPCETINFKKEFKKANQLKPEEAGIFLRKAKSDNWQYYPVAFLAFHLGMRSGELAALRKSHIDLKSCIIHVKESVTNKGIRKLPKNGSPRERPFSPEVKDFLMLYLPTIKGRDVFPMDTFPALHRGEMSKEFKTRCKYYGLPPVKFHSTRGTCATTLLFKGVDPVTAAMLTGHDDLDTFFKHYVNPIRNEKRAKEAAALLSYESDDDDEK